MEHRASTSEGTQRQRQNAAKREAKKAEAIAAEVERQRVLAQHKRDLLKARMDEQYKSGGGKKAAGGMQASVNEHGSLIWE